MEMVNHELIGDSPAPNRHEQLGQFLRHAFPLGQGAFSDLPDALKQEGATAAPGNEESMLFDWPKP